MEGEIYQCSVCKMKHRIDGFGVNRLGIRMKSCNSCRARSQRQRADNKANQNSAGERIRVIKM